MSARVAPAAVALALLLGAAGSLRAQQTLVLPEPRGTAVALSVDLDAGGIADSAGQEGVSRLAAEALLEQIRPRLGALGAVARLQCEGFGLRFTLVAPPPTWHQAAQELLDGIFHPSLSPAALDTAQERLLRSLRFQQDDPAAEIRLAARQALFGNGPLASGPCGRPETVASLTLEDARAAARAFVPSRAAAALVGPVGAQEGIETLTAILGNNALPVQPPPQPAPLPGTREIESPTITSWLAVAYPLPAKPNDEATRFLAESLARSLRPSPLRPEVVDAAVELERFGDSGALVVYLAVEPPRADIWIARVQEMVAAAGTTPLDENDFALQLRRYRGLRLLALETPEARAADAADRLLFDRAFVLPEARIDALTTEQVRAAAAALGPPAIAYLGPARTARAPVEQNMRQPQVGRAFPVVGRDTVAAGRGDEGTPWQTRMPSMSTGRLSTSTSIRTGSPGSASIDRKARQTS